MVTVNVTGDDPTLKSVHWPVIARNNVFQARGFYPLLSSNYSWRVPVEEVEQLALNPKPLNPNES